MPTAFVTGATGFIGAHVARTLIAAGWRVRGLKRRGSPHSADLGDIDWREGDIRSLDQVSSSMSGCDAVFHIAADYRLWARNPGEIYESNVTGTGNVFQAALTHKIQKVVYTSSVGALGLTSDGSPADEAVPVSLGDMVGHYKRSKFLAERKADEYIERGLPIVIVNPSTPVGPGDRKPTPTGKIIVDFLNGKMPAYLNTGLNLVHVKDVAAGHVLAFDRGRVGEKYILGNTDLTLAEIFRRLEVISGVKAPRVRLPYRPVLFLAYIFKGLSALTGREPLIPFEGVKMARRTMFFDSSKAVRELGLPQTPVDVALSEAVRWFRENGYAPGRDRSTELRV